MDCPNTIVFVRHAESEGNVITVDERAAFENPTWNYHLTQTGKQQAQITGAYLRTRFPMGFDFFYTSYYTRAKETLGEMYPNINVIEDSRLAEAQRGIYHTMTKKEIQKYFPMELERKNRENLYHYRPWGGENWPDVELRIHSWLQTICRDCKDKSVLVVMHGHWMLLLQKILEGFSIEEALGRYHRRAEDSQKKRAMFENASVTIYKKYFNYGLMLEEENIIPWQNKL